MTSDERRRRGMVLCQKLAGEVEHLARTTALDTQFLIALTAWEHSGTEADRLNLKDAYGAVINAVTSVTSATAE